MSQGSPIVCVRVPVLLLAALDSVIAEYNEAKPTIPLTRSNCLLEGLSRQINQLQREVAEREIQNAKPANRKCNTAKRLKRLSKKIHG